MKDLLWFAQNGPLSTSKTGSWWEGVQWRGRDRLSWRVRVVDMDQDRKNQSCHFWLENHRDLRASHARHLLPELQSLE